MILRTKLHIPHVRSALVPRPALINHMNAGLKAKLTIVTAPAGYGKTTLISEWAKQCGASFVWISLDRHDNDYVRFWSYVIAAIEKVRPSITARLQPFLTDLAAPQDESLIISLINELNELHTELVIILDDFHVIESDSIYTSLTYFLEHIPPNIHLCIASRSEVPVPTARLQAKGHLHKIIAHHLRFHLDEGIHFFQECMDLRLTREEVSRLVFCTEGWISGLHMAALSLGKSMNYDECIRSFNGHQRDIATYLLEEVFQQQSEQMRAFLLETSILNRMNSDLCEAVTGQTHCQELLERLEQQNLWMVPLDEQRNWYRYHHLFSDFLRRQFRQKQLPQYEQAQARAAVWLESSGFAEDAMDHFLEGKHYVQAVQLIENLLPALMNTNWMVLRRWLSIMPDPFIAEKPMIDILYIGVLLGEGEDQLAETRIQQAQMRLRTMQDSFNEEKWKQLMGTLYLFWAISAFIQKEIHRTSECLLMFEEYLPEGSYLQMLGGNMSQGPEYGDLLRFINHMRTADQFMQRWIKAWGHKKNYPFVGYFYVSYSELMYEWNRLDEAGFYAEQVLERKDMQPFAQILVQAAISASRIQLAKGNSERAFEIMEQVKTKIDSPDHSGFMKKIDAQIIYVSQRQGSRKDALSWLEVCGLSQTDDIPMNRISEYIFYARMLMEYGQLADALYVIERLYRKVCNEDSLRDKIKVLILQSLMLYRKGNMQNSLMKLAEALHLAEPEGYVRSFVDEGDDMGELLSRYLHLRQNSSIRESSVVSLLYVKKLLLVINENSKGRLSLSTILTSQEEKILRLVEKGLSNKQIAEHNNIRIGTVKTHIKNMYRKLEVNSRLQALQRGRELDLL